MFGIENSANNFGASAGLLANTLANRPVQAALGTLFVGTNNLIVYRYNGVAWDTIGGGGGVFGGATNGCSLYGSSVGLGGILSDNTQINCYNFTFSFINYYDFYIGNFTEPTLALSNVMGVESIRTYYNSQHIGLDINYFANQYRFGNFNSGSYYMLDAAQVLFSVSDGNSVGFYINRNINTTLGDYSGAINSLSINFDYGNNRIDFYSGDGYYNFANIPAYANNAAAIAGGLVVGDIYRHTGGGGETLHIVF